MYEVWLGSGSISDTTYTYLKSLPLFLVQSKSLGRLRSPFGIYSSLLASAHIPFVIPC